MNVKMNDKVWLEKEEPGNSKIKNLKLLPFIVNKIKKLT